MKIPKSAKLVFKGILFDVYHWEQELFDGSKKTFEKLKRKDSVNVVPVLEDGRILLVDEEQPLSDKFVTAPGGQIEENETPEKAARRELLEETGYTAEKLDLWLTVNPYKKIDWTVSTFIAHGCKKVAESTPDEGERISLRPVSFDEYIEIALGDPKYRNTEITLEIMNLMRKTDGLDKIKKLLS